jgi:hypothetical protein
MVSARAIAKAADEIVEEVNGTYGNKDGSIQAVR